MINSKNEKENRHDKNCHLTSCLKNKLHIDENEKCESFNGVLKRKKKKVTDKSRKENTGTQTR